MFPAGGTTVKTGQRFFGEATNHSDMKKPSEKKNRYISSAGKQASMACHTDGYAK